MKVWYRAVGIDSGNRSQKAEAKTVTNYRRSHSFKKLSLLFAEPEARLVNLKFLATVLFESSLPGRPPTASLCSWDSGTVSLVCGHPESIATETSERVMR